MAALETVIVQHERATSPRQQRISGRVRVAVDAMVLEGLNRKQAAERAGLVEHSLYVALTKPHVLAYLNSQMRVLRTSAASRTIAKAEQLMDLATSEHVQADMTKWLAGLEGISPISRSENLHVHQHVIPGLTVIRGNYSDHGAEALLITDQRAENESAHQINRIGEPVPHPEAKNAAVQVIEPPPRPRRGKAGTRATGGQK